MAELSYRFIQISDQAYQLLPEEERFYYHRREEGVWAKLVESAAESTNPSQSRRKKISQRKRWAIFKRDGYTCTYCYTTDGPFEIDHIHPVALGGDNHPSNLTTACKRCNNKKGARVDR
jgi:5-methylcytosine-specific restriction endonuclease McrA